MVALLLKIILYIITFLLNLASQLIFKSAGYAAYAMLSLFHASKVPGQVIQAALDHIAEALEGCSLYLLEFIWEAVSYLISSGFDILMKVLIGSFSITSLAVQGLSEMARTSIEGLIKDLPEILEGLMDMVSSVATNLYNNYNDAIAYIIDNALF